MIFGERELARRRVALVERSAAVRRSLATHGAPFFDKAVAADRLITTVRSWLPWVTSAITIYTLLRRFSQRRQASETTPPDSENRRDGPTLSPTSDAKSP
ncbi:MAG TPA: hypothetical protein VFJ70_21525 [Burkholderiales bacterium]|nr:hypothetical protein [Burkholderiales bacterium]